MDSVFHESILFDQFVAVVRIDVPIQREDVASRHVAGDDGDDARVGGAVVAGVGEFALLLLKRPFVDIQQPLGIRHQREFRRLFGDEHPPVGPQDLLRVGSRSDPLGIDGVG